MQVKIVQFALSVTIYKIFAVEMCMVLIVTSRKGQGQM